MQKENVRVGENAVEKTVRLLARANERFANPDHDELRYIDLRLTQSGAGDLHYASGELLFHFESLPELATFLEAPLTLQVRAIAGQAG
jgi:hypothetical protein